MLRIKMTVTLTTLLLLANQPTLAGIPMPDAVAVGTVCLDGTPATAADTEVVVIGRRGGASGPIVGRYRMGDRSAAGDSFVLRIRVESLADGVPARLGWVRAGDTVDVFVQQDSESPEQPAGSLLISEAGTVASLDITLGAACVTDCPGDTNGDGAVDLTDLAVVITNFGTPSGATRMDGDLDGDGDIDLGDLAIVITEFASTCG